MSTSHMTPSSDRLEDLARRGFTHNFALEDETVIDLDDHTHYVPEQVEIVEEYREEGQSDPADSSVVLALRAPDGVLGTLIAAYGPENEHAEALRRLGQDAPKHEAGGAGA